MSAKSEELTQSAGADEIALDRHLLDELAASGFIDAPTRRASLDWLHPPHRWAHWVMLLMLAFGTGLILAGVIFFFAFNWAAIPDLAKLAIIQAGIVITACGAWYLGLKPLVGRLLLLASSILVGVFLAVMGQIYQTGADAWQLFALWVILVIPWTIISRFAAQWVIWLGLVNLAIHLWWNASIVPLRPSLPLLSLTHALLIGGMLLLREGLARSSAKGAADVREWLRPIWTRWALLAGMLLFLFPILFEWLTDTNSDETILVLCGIIALIVTIALGFIYRHLLFDVPALAMVLLMVSMLITVAFAVFADENGMDELAITITTALVAILTFAGSTGYLRILLAKQQQEAADAQS